MKTSVRDVELDIVPGDITALEVDALVNAANSELRMGSGVAGAIKRTGGDSIEKEAMAQAPIAAGSALATTGGTLKAKWVIHAAVMGADLQTNADLIARATRSALEIADRCHVRSVAIPALGTGVGGFSIYACANLMMAEVRSYIESHKRTGLRRVVFSVYSDTAKAAFKNAMAGGSRF
jgi:O-acetyl-ADP-ribose deacetylase (regulator of RNase III)